MKLKSQKLKRDELVLYRRVEAAYQGYDCAMRFSDFALEMDRQKSSRGEWGWALAELIDEHGHQIPGGRFLFWSPSSLEVRHRAYKALTARGLTEAALLIDGVPAKDYRMHEAVGARTVRARP